MREERQNAGRKAKCGIFRTIAEWLTPMCCGRINSIWLCLFSLCFSHLRHESLSKADQLFEAASRFGDLPEDSDDDLDDVHGDTLTSDTLSFAVHTGLNASELKVRVYIMHLWSQFFSCDCACKLDNIIAGKVE